MLMPMKWKNEPFSLQMQITSNMACVKMYFNSLTNALHDRKILMKPVMILSNYSNRLKNYIPWTISPENPSIG